MAPATSWQGVIVKGRVNWKDKAGIQKYIETLEGRRVTITIEEFSAKRSHNQNRYFHGVVCEYLSEATGFEPFEIKELMKAMFLSHVDRRGRIHIRGTSTLTRRQMSEFLERVMRWAAMWLDLYIPPAERFAEVWAA